MPTYRIITNGEKFRVQRKGLFGWHLEGRRFGYGGFEPYDYKSREEAMTDTQVRFAEENITFEDGWCPL